MAELLANDFATTLAASATSGATTISVASAAPTALQGTGQFRIRIDNELLIVTGGAATTTWTVTRGAEGTTAAAHASAAPVTHVLTAGAVSQAVADALSTGGQYQAKRAAWFPTGVIEENYDREETASVAMLGSGLAQMTGRFWLPAGKTVTQLRFYSGATGATTPTLQQAGITDMAGNVIAVTEDRTTEAWAANTAKTFTLATSWVVPSDTAFRVFLLVAAATTPTMMAKQNASGTFAIFNATPPIGGRDSVTRSTPITVGTALAFSTNEFRAFYAACLGS